MRIVYVGDNRNRGNFGCRATSTALSQLIEKNHEIIAKVSGRYTNNDTGELFYYEHIPQWVYKSLGKKRRWPQLKTGLYLLIRLLRLGKQYIFSNYDYLKYDLDKSISNFLKCLPANPHLKEFDLRNYDFDALVVNGEGSFIFRKPAWRESINEAMLMHWAQKMGKKVYYMNGMLSDDPYTERNEEVISLVRPVFEKTQVVCVREYYSEKYAREAFPKANIKIYPDALFSWYDYINDNFKIPNGKYVMGPNGATNSSFTDFDFEKPYILISGSSAVGTAAKDRNEAVICYSKLVNRVKESFSQNVYIIIVCEGDYFLNEVGYNTNTPIISMDTPILSAGKILSNADVFISGRYHPAILASMGGTPCVFMSSNSHKTISLQELLNYHQRQEYNVIPSDEDISKMIKDAQRLISEGESKRSEIMERCKALKEKAILMSQEIV